MNKIIASVLTVLLVAALIPLYTFADTPGAGGGVGINIETEQFVPRVFMDPDARVFRHNAADGGRILVERIENYAFEGESIIWEVLVWDKNGIDKVSDVFVQVSDDQVPDPDAIEVNCGGSTRTSDPPGVYFGDPVALRFDPNTMRWYTCEFYVETPQSMYGEFWLTAVAEDLDGLLGSFDENEKWFLNPVLSIFISGNIDFGVVTPGNRVYSDTLEIENTADTDSGVMLDMFISGSDFYDSSNSGAKCPSGNVLKLNNGNNRCDGDPRNPDHDNFCYYAVNGAYSTNNDPNADPEGYSTIPYENDLALWHGRTQIIKGPLLGTTTGIPPRPLYMGNVLSPGADMSVTFRLDLPLPCNGNFDSGQIFFWGEAV